MIEEIGARRAAPVRIAQEGIAHECTAQEGIAHERTAQEGIAHERLAAR
jgi:hypothetical protein